MQEPRLIRFDFVGHGELGAAGDAGAGPFVQNKTGTPGDIVNENGYLKIPIAATSEAEINCAYFGDELSFDVDDIKQIRIGLHTVADLGSGVSAVVGVGSARNDTVDNVTANLWVRIADTNVLYVESDDGTTDNDDKATGLSMGATDLIVVFDFDNGVLMRSPLESGSVGGKKHILVSIDNGDGYLRRVCADTVFTLNGYTAGLQPIFQIQKASGTGTGALYVKFFEVLLKS